MHTDSVTTTVPSQRSGVDRRKGPRRAEEAAVHYAILNVVAAAEQWADPTGWGDINTEAERRRSLSSAVELYQRAVAAAAVQ